MEPMIKRLCLGPVAEVDPRCPKNLLLCRNYLLSMSARVLFHSFEPEPPLQWGICIGLLAPADIHPFHPASFQHPCEQWRSLLPLFPGGGMCWGNLLGSCSNNSSLGRAELSAVLEVLTAIPQILGVGGGNWDCERSSERWQFNWSG